MRILGYPRPAVKLGIAEVEISKNIVFHDTFNSAKIKPIYIHGHKKRNITYKNINILCRFPIDNILRKKLTALANALFFYFLNTIVVDLRIRHFLNILYAPITTEILVASMPNTYFESLFHDLCTLNFSNILKNTLQTNYY